MQGIVVVSLLKINEQRDKKQKWKLRRIRLFSKKQRWKRGNMDGLWSSAQETYIFFFFLGPNLWHMEVLKLGVALELQPPAYKIATAEFPSWRSG